jgi:hypothetical protein
MGKKEWVMENRIPTDWPIAYYILLTARSFYT